MWKQLPRATMYQRCSMLMKSVSSNFWASQMSVLKISVLNLSLHPSLLSLLLSAYACIYLPVYFFCLLHYLFIFLFLSAPDHQGMAVRGKCHSRCRAACHVDLCCWWLSWTHGDLDKVKLCWQLGTQMLSTLIPVFVRCQHFAILI